MVNGSPVRAPGDRTILVIDDSTDARGFMGTALRSEGYRVLEAEDGVIGLWVVEDRNAPIDLVILDVVMPMMDGPAFLRGARAFHASIRALFVTGHEDAILRKHGLDPAAVDLLRKPFDQPTLLARVREALGG